MVILGKKLESPSFPWYTHSLRHVCTESLRNNPASSTMPQMAWYAKATLEIGVNLKGSYVYWLRQVLFLKKRVVSKAER